MPVVPWHVEAELIHQVVKEIDVIVGIGCRKGIAAGDAGEVAGRIGDARGAIVGASMSLSWTYCPGKSLWIGRGKARQYNGRCQ